MVEALSYMFISIFRLLNEDSITISSVDLIQLMLQEVETLINEVRDLVTSCTEVVKNENSTKVEQIIPLSRSMTKALSLAQNDCLAPKEFSEIPRYYVDLLFPHQLLNPKVEPPDDSTNFNYCLSSPPIATNELDLDGAPKRKYQKHKDSKAKKRRPTVKNIPPELKLTDEENSNVVESQRRRRCEVCTKGFQNKKKLEHHISNGDCPGKPNPKWHYFNYVTKKLYCIHKSCLTGKNGTFDIDTHQSFFKCSGMSKDYLKHVLDQHTTPENCPYPCDSCEIKFPNLYLLKYHKDRCGENVSCKIEITLLCFQVPKMANVNFCSFFSFHANIVDEATRIEEF